MLPNFLIVGAAKAGTTSLYNYLSQHPQVYMSLTKEPRYFAPEYYTAFCKNAIDGSSYRKDGLPIEEYKVLFDGVRDEIAIGEASTEYLFFEKSASRIKNIIPDAKIIIILRNPVARAFSAYSYHLHDGRETLSFEEALEHESFRAQEQWQVGWLYKQGGLYYEQVRRYYDMFDPKRIKIILWEDLNQNPLGACIDVFEFLHVDIDFVPGLSRANKSLSPRSKLMNRYLFQNRKLKQMLRASFPESTYNSVALPLKRLFFMGKASLKLKTRQYLKEFYSDDIQKLEALTSLNLSSWRE